MPTLIEEKQKKWQICEGFCRIFRNLSLGCPEGICLFILLQTYRHNLHADIETNMGTIRDHTWKELQE